MVYGVVQRHGGTISVDSRVGVGTEFVITLPRTYQAMTNHTE
jgi:signal transduction histidine kinase